MTREKAWMEMAVRSISTQCHFAALSYANINAKAASNNDLVFSSIHSFLSHTSNISKQLIAKIPIYLTISNLIKVADDSIIHETRHYRDHLEHYYDRIKRWVDKINNNTHIKSFGIGPINGSIGVFYEQWYDPNTNTYVILGESLNLDKIIREVTDIKLKADDFILNLTESIF